MIRLSGALAAALTLAAGLAGTAKAETVYYYDDTPSLTYSPRVYTYGDPVIVAPRTYYTAPSYYVAPPSYSYRSNTSYYYASPPGYVSAPYGYVTTPYGYVPPGLSVTIPTGTYAPLYGGWNSYSNENIGGYDGYRTTTDH